MNIWNQVKSVIGSAAPMVGTLLGGPAGTAIGAMISSALGVENSPDAILKELKDNPDAIIKIKQIEANHSEKLQALSLSAGTQRLETVNQTMRDEGKSEHWPQWAWRPFWGFVSGLAFLCVSVLCCYLAYQAVMEGKPAALNMIPQLVTSFTTLFGIPGAILGITAWHRGKEKIAKIDSNARN